jgi:acyl dehydratase
VTTIVSGLDELKGLAGTDLGHTGWLAVSQQRVNAFADATGDHQWIHVDPERAAAGPFGGTIAHGYLTLSLVVPLFTELLEVREVRMGINYGLDKVRFPAPVPAGSRIRLGAVVTAAEPAGRRAVQLSMDFTVAVAGRSGPACEAQAIYRYYA